MPSQTIKPDEAVYPVIIGSCTTSSGANITDVESFFQRFAFETQETAEDLPFGEKQGLELKPEKKGSILAVIEKDGDGTYLTIRNDSLEQVSPVFQVRSNRPSSDGHDIRVFDCTSTDSDSPTKKLRLKVLFTEAQLPRLETPPKPVRPGRLPIQEVVTLQSTEPPTVSAPLPARPSPVTETAPEVKKKMGRPRKYALVVVTPPKETSTTPVEEDRVITILVSEILEDLDQPRKEFDATDINNLGSSMKHGGQGQNVIVEPLVGTDGKKWLMVDGHRRLRGAREQGLPTLQAVVKIFKTVAEKRHFQFSVNCNRRGHTPLEESDFIASAKTYGKTIEEIAREMGRCRNYVYQRLELQKLAPQLREQMRKSVHKKQRMRLQVAMVLARIPDHEKQIEIWNQVKDEPKPLLLRLKVEKIVGQISADLPKVGRKTKPSDMACQILNLFSRLHVGSVAISDLKKDAIDALINLARTRNIDLEGDLRRALLPYLAILEKIKATQQQK